MLAAIPTGRIDPFSAESLALARQRFAREFIACGQDPADAAALADWLAGICRDRGAAGFDALGTRLAQTGIRQQWNARLDHARAEALADWIAPQLAGGVLDLLGGSGAIAAALARRGCAPVLAVERRQHMGAFAAFPRTPFEQFLKSARPAMADSVLLCTVLHHEADPVALLARAASLARRRIVIVENCIDADHPRDYQEFVDLFFNFCLNRTGLPAGSQHRAADGWCRLGAAWGDARLIDCRDDIPGIPLSHALITIDLDRAPMPRAGNCPPARIAR
ncbi:MAG: hypothetical protein B7Y43_00200 [Sphingomonas sp. 28-62-20]|uniref:hypothetical protein n=1 Tax=Sphingomonas sp. 28-62-20 TaxID=1970433 RepID=UPI000BD8BC56|nr:MAG: hypothetical protein B7Y43_00200 [Sphingomonas sp. 28-62-20]